MIFWSFPTNQISLRFTGNPKVDLDNRYIIWIKCPWGSGWLLWIFIGKELGPLFFSDPDLVFVTPACFFDPWLPFLQTWPYHLGIHITTKGTNLWFTTWCWDTRHKVGSTRRCFMSTPRWVSVDVGFVSSIRDLKGLTKQFAYGD